MCSFDIEEMIRKGEGTTLSKMRSFEDKSGHKKYVAEIIANSFMMSDKGSDKAEINEGS